MLFNATFSNISVISVLLVEETGVPARRKPPTCRKSLTSFITQGCIEYTSPCAGFELTTTLVVVGTDCIGNCDSNYHNEVPNLNPDRTFVVITSNIIFTFI